MDTESSRRKTCSKCDVELVNATGVHMGIPFGHWHIRDTNSGRLTRRSMLVCSNCYDEITVNPDTKVER